MWIYGTQLWGCINRSSTLKTHLAKFPIGISYDQPSFFLSSCLTNDTDYIATERLTYCMPHCAQRLKQQLYRSPTLDKQTIGFEQITNNSSKAKPCVFRFTTPICTRFVVICSNY